MSDATDSTSSGDSELVSALREGDPQKVQKLIEAGADIHYKRPCGYDALIDAAIGGYHHKQFIELLALLVKHGVSLSRIGDYGESGLRVLSHVGQFDAIRFLISAGADKSQLQWTPLHETVAIGSLTDVRNLLDHGAELEDRDWWSRTAWLIALLMGDIQKATLLRERGADTNVRGRCGQPPVFYAIRGHQPDMLRWLLQNCADVHQTDDFGTTALVEAVEHEDLACIEILLAAGAEVNINHNGTAINHAQSRDIILRLLDADADPADVSYEGQRAVIGLPLVPEDDPLAAIWRDEFQRDTRRSFGISNPQRMNVPFWEAMIRSGASAYDARRRFDDSPGSLEQSVWCARRYGQSFTFLPNGCIVQIGGEHEDHYDPDFCIYNDVFVHGLDGSIAVYGYPEEVFPPTDFHTATLVGDFIYVIGALGYLGARAYGVTPVYRLDLATFAMEHLNTRGDAPGWIHRHRAVTVGSRQIRVCGGKILTENGEKKSQIDNLGSFVLDLESLLWRQE